MRMNNYTAKLLNLEDVIITNVESMEDQLHIYLELPRVEQVFLVLGFASAFVHFNRDIGCTCNGLCLDA